MGLQCEERLAVLVLFVIGCSCLVNSTANSSQEDTGCSGEISSRDSTFTEKTVSHSKHLDRGPPRVINLIHGPKYGYLGDADVPGFQNLSSFDHRSSTGKWRVVCRRVSKIVVVVLSVEMENDGEFLQMRRKTLTGTNNMFYSYILNKNSILVTYVDPEPASSGRTHYPFRLVYFCLKDTKFDVLQETSRVRIAEHMLMNRDILTYLQTHQEGIEKLGELFETTDINYSLNNHKDPETKTMIGLAYFGSAVIKDHCGRKNVTLRFT